MEIAEMDLGDHLRGSIDWYPIRPEETGLKLTRIGKPTPPPPPWIGATGSKCSPVELELVQGLLYPQTTFTAECSGRVKVRKGVCGV